MGEGDQRECVRLPDGCRREGSGTSGCGNDRSPDGSFLHPAQSDESPFQPDWSKRGEDGHSAPPWGLVSAVCPAAQASAGAGVGFPDGPCAVPPQHDVLKNLIYWWCFFDKYIYIPRSYDNGIFNYKQCFWK